MTVDDLPIGQVARVAHLTPDTMNIELTERLEEIGFTLGETVAVLTRGLPGGDPLVVRIGQSRFALRRTEAQRVHVVVERM